MALLTILLSDLATMETSLYVRRQDRDSLIKTEQCLENALAGLQTELPLDLVAVDLHAALDHIGVITGHVTSEDILDQIFREFCIGK
jgi:tRNA modification GTPase